MMNIIDYEAKAFEIRLNKHVKDEFIGLLMAYGYHYDEKTNVVSIKIYMTIFEKIKEILLIKWCCTLDALDAICHYVLHKQNQNKCEEYVIEKQLEFRYLPVKNNQATYRVNNNVKLFDCDPSVLTVETKEYVYDPSNKNHIKCIQRLMNDSNIQKKIICFTDKGVHDYYAIDKGKVYAIAIIFTYLVKVNPINYYNF